MAWLFYSALMLGLVAVGGIGAMALGLANGDSVSDKADALNRSIKRPYELFSQLAQAGTRWRALAVYTIFISAIVGVTAFGGAYYAVQKSAPKMLGNTQTLAASGIAILREMDKAYLVVPNELKGATRCPIAGLDEQFHCYQLEGPKP